MNPQYNALLSRLKFWRVARGLALCGLLVPTVATLARAEEQNPECYIALDLDKLIKDWKVYQNVDVLVKGRLHCVDQSYCDLVPASGVSRTVFVRISDIDESQKRHLEASCLESDCLVSVFGWVGTWQLYALAVQDSGS
jgi:hypothetical protein